MLPTREYPITHVWELNLAHTRTRMLSLSTQQRMLQTENNTSNTVTGYLLDTIYKDMTLPTQRYLPTHHNSLSPPYRHLKLCNGAQKKKRTSLLIHSEF